MVAPESFRCDECGAFPGQSCIYVWPNNVQPYSIDVYWDGNWGQIPVVWDGYRPYREQILQMERWIRIGGREVEWSINPKSRSFQRSHLPSRYARVGTPTDRPHNSRHRAVYDWELQAEYLALQEYLREWLEEFGDIFALD